MTPPARLQAAIDILEEITRTGRAADRVLEAWGRAHRFAGAKDRAAIAERVFAVLRRRGECAAIMDGAQAPRAWVLGSLRVIDGLDTPAIDALVNGTGYGPAALTADERARLDATPAGAAGTRWLNLPSWLRPELERSLGAQADAELAAMEGRAPLDLRVNTLKATPAQARAALEAEGILARPLAAPATALRVETGTRGLERTQAHRDGLIEIQDAGSQMAAALTEARPGEVWIDLAAGAGGKALALAAQMQNRGRIHALDADARRLAALAPRAARAGATIIAADPASGFGAARDALAAGAADGVLVDAPCSGTGTWRRNPETRWSLTPEKLRGYRCAQGELLAAAARLVRPGGRVVYVTCSLLCAENEDAVAAFLADHPGWQVSPAAAAWDRMIGRPPPAGVDRVARLSPAASDTDGFFIASLLAPALDTGFTPSHPMQP